MAKDTPNTPKKEKGGNSPFRKFEQLAKKIVRVPKDQVKKDNGTKVGEHYRTPPCPTPKPKKGK